MTMQRLSKLALGALLLVGFATRLDAAASVQVKLQLPMRARIDLTGRQTVAIAPFLVVGREGADTRAKAAVDLQKEFERYLLKLLRRETALKVVEPGPIDYPSYDLDVLARDQDFWRNLGERIQSDLILAGSLDFDVQDRSGYRSEEYVSPFDGRTYMRQVLVEQTGFDYDIVLQVYDGKTGALLLTDNFKDFKQFEAEKTDTLSGMFENLMALEDRIVGVFKQKTVDASRVLFTD
jgi:hypothetical protein